ncbi:MAG TPA: M15 family metallopeptidase, partial [Pyrinomonadaceae bacterium]|nr:M15 family metallopeptidase [Pyrinomonadaceae bacterium]
MFQCTSLRVSKGGTFNLGVSPLITLGLVHYGLALLTAFLILSFQAVAQDGPPREQGKREAHLVELITLDPTIKLDIRYATDNNFVGKTVYPEARAFLQKPAAKAVAKVHKKLRKQGLGLAIFDGYRPWSITKLFWEVTPEDKRMFVANPASG